MPELREMLQENPVIAVVGASTSPAKFGNKILKNLHRKGYTVIPVHRHGGEIEAMKAYKNLTEASQDYNIDIVDYVVPAKMTLKSLKEADSLGLKNAWVQPGAEDAEVIDYLEENHFNYLAGGPCIMVEA